jgi:hypothetical protein
MAQNAGKKFMISASWNAPRTFDTPTSNYTRQGNRGALTHQANYELMPLDDIKRISYRIVSTS